MTPSITISVTAIGTNLNSFLMVFWPYLLVIAVSVILILISVSIDISAIMMLAGRHQRDLNRRFQANEEWRKKDLWERFAKNEDWLSSR